MQATQQHTGHRLAFTIRDRDAFPDEDCVLIDYDDVRDPDTGMIHPTVRDHLEQAGSYAEVSTSGTGIHILCRGGLPDGIKSITAQLPHEPTFPDAGIEVYDSKRFIAITGEHLTNTPEHTVECQEFLYELAKEFATVSESTPDQAVDEPEKTAEEIRDIETTTDIQDLFDAIEYTTPRDIRLRSTVTEERSDSSKSLDPS